MMLRDAINEIRLRPGRFVATLVAVAISVGFIAAILVAVRTEENSLARTNALPAAKADVVVSDYFLELNKAEEVIGGVEGVDALAPVLESPVLVSSKSGKANLFRVLPLPDEEFRWASLVEGQWPSGLTEIALAAKDAAKIDVKLGDSVEVGGVEGEVKVVGLTDDPAGLSPGTGYLPAEFGAEADSANFWLIRSSDPEGTAARLLAKLQGTGSFYNDTIVATAENYRTESLKKLTGDFDVFRNLLLGFAAVALIVGMIIIGNTFTILLTQRRRQIGLLRAVGASSGQVVGRLVAEAVLLGLVGSLIGVLLGAGVALVAALFTGAIHWGLVLPWTELAIAVGVGVLATVLSVVGPSLAATRVSPLEALQVVPTATKAKRLSIARGVICLVLFAGAAVLILMAFQAPEQGLLWALPGGGLLSIAILLAAPFYVPFLLRVLGGVFSFGGPTVRLAVGNAVRNPRRASATAVALMLAVGLIVTLQVAVATMRSSALEAINEQFPVDLTLRSQEPLEQRLIDRVTGFDNVESVEFIPSKEVQVGEGFGSDLSVRSVNPVVTQWELPDKMIAPEDAIVVNDGLNLPDVVELPGVGQLRVVQSAKVESGLAAVSEAVFEKLPGTAEDREAWVKLKDRSDLGSILNDIVSLMDSEREITVGGGAFPAGILIKIVEVLLIVLTALLGVAVVIALVGVGNTLGLSVLERQRESALLRALGMQRSSLRVMLLVEALLLGVVGVGVGILAGAFFSWLGVTTTLGMMPEGSRVDAVFSVDLLYTGGLILVCLLAAALASVLPGRKAANATPTEALAAE